jgi:nucleoside-diphosphate-sugar epimerase
MNSKDRPILITGGTGFIASYLAMHLMEAGAHVVLFDCNPDQRRITGFNKGPSNPKDPNYDPKDRFNAVRHRATFVQGDLTLLPHVLSVFEKYRPKSVFHLGALLSAGADANPTFGFEVDLLGARNVLEAARIYGEPDDLIKVLFPSTIASFGLFPFPDLPANPKQVIVRPPKPEDGLIVPNEAVQMPGTMYGVSKVAVERLGEYYHSKSWVDFRAVRFPSVVGAARGPGGTTVYSTLMIQMPLLKVPKQYAVYVPKDTRLDIIYVKDAVNALLRLHDAKDLKLRRVYNIAGIRMNGLAPQASDIEAAVKRRNRDAVITYETNQQLTDIVHTFGILGGTAAQDDWQWAGPKLNLDETVADFKDDLDKYPNRIKSVELY